MGEVLDFAVSRQLGAERPVAVSIQAVEVSRLLALSAMAQILARLVERAGPGSANGSASIVASGNEIVRRLANFELAPSMTIKGICNEAAEMRKVGELSKEWKATLAKAGHVKL